MDTQDLHGPPREGSRNANVHTEWKIGSHGRWRHKGADANRNKKQAQPTQPELLIVAYIHSPAGQSRHSSANTRYMFPASLGIFSPGGLYRISEPENLPATQPENKIEPEMEMWGDG